MVIFFITIKLYGNISAEVDIYRYCESKELFYAFHVYKGKEYFGTYTLTANNLKSARQKLKNNELKGFYYNGGKHIIFKTIKEL